MASTINDLKNLFKKAKKKTLDATTIDEKIGKVFSDSKRGYQIGAKNLSNTYKAVKDPNTRGDYLSGLAFTGLNNANKRSPMSKQFQQLGDGNDFNRAARTVGIGRPMVENTFNSVKEGVGNLWNASAKMGVANPQTGQANTLGQRAQGFGQALRGTGQVLAPIRPDYQTANFLANQPKSLDKNDYARRISGGFLQGQTQLDNLTDRGSTKTTNLPLIGETDLARGAGSMLGFVRNPVNQRVFAGTESFNIPVKLFNKSANKIASFITTNMARGGTEDILLQLDQFPDDVSNREKAQWVATTFLQGGTAETGVRGLGNIPGASVKKLSQVFDQLRGNRAKSRIGQVKPQEEIKRQSPLVQSILQKLVQPRLEGGLYGEKAKLTQLEGLVYRIANAFADAGRDITNLSAQRRKQFNEDLFDLTRGDQDFQREILNRLSNDTVTFRPKPDGTGLVREGLEPAYGGLAGVDPEFDEEGNLTGIGYDPARGAAGLAVMGGVKAARNLPTKGVEALRVYRGQVANNFNRSGLPNGATTDFTYKGKTTSPRGISTSTDEKIAKGFGKNVFAFDIDRSAKILDANKIPEELLKGATNTRHGVDYGEAIKYAQKRGYDAIDFSKLPQSKQARFFGKAENEIRILNPDILLDSPTRGVEVNQRGNELSSLRQPQQTLQPTTGNLRIQQPSGLKVNKTVKQDVPKSLDNIVPEDGSYQRAYQRGDIAKRLKEVDELIGFTGSGGNYKQDFAQRESMIKSYLNDETGFVPQDFKNKLQEAVNNVDMAKSLKRGETDPTLSQKSFITERDLPNVDKIINTEKQIKAAQDDFKQWEKAMFKDEGARFTARSKPRLQAEGVAEIIQRGTLSPATRNVSTLKDISAIDTGFKDLYRNFKQVFGKQYDTVKRVLLDPFDTAKGNFIREQQQVLENLDKTIVKKLGITKKSPESKAVQLYGEGQLNEQDLISQFGKNKAKKIQQADQWFRSEYDRLLDEMNAVRKQIYPNNPEKIIPKRKDYYRHYREIAQGFAGLKNLFENPSNIAPGLEGISANTKPRSKWQSFMQQRLGSETDIDAVGGFLDYLKGATYAKHIDPFIPQFRALREELVQATEQPGKPEYGQLNNFVRFLDQFANDLAGKTNPADRYVQDITGRKVFGAINWLNNRVKANVILANASSSVAQIFNVPQGMANAGAKQWVPGVMRSVEDVLNKDTAIKNSDFINERFFRSYDRFDKGMIENGRKLAGWITGVWDEVGTKYIWNMHYNKALQDGIQNPIKYADDITKEMVGGRGVGEVPLTQKSKLFQLVAPFQLEVANLWHVQKGFLDEKAFGKLATLYMLNWIFNRGAEQIRGSDVTFDPIQAVYEAYQAYDEEENKGIGAMRAGGRITGEVLSNLPVLQTFAAAYPEYGFKIGDTQYPTREEFFGDADPTRFGSGLLAVKGLEDPIFKVIPPYGGQQLKRTIDGIRAGNRGYSETPTGRVRFPIEKTPLNRAKSAIFGQYSTPEARAYFNQDRSVLGENQSEQFKNATPEERKTYYDQLMANREAGKRSGTIKVSANEPQAVQIKLPSKEDQISVLYKDALSTLNSYEDNKTKIEYGVKEYDTDLDKKTALQELESDRQKAEELISRIKQEKPEELLNIQIDTYKSGSGAPPVAERAEWAASVLEKIEDEKQLEDTLNKLYDGNVLTRSVVNALAEDYDIKLGEYVEGGKRKSSGGKGKKIKLGRTPTLKLNATSAPRYTSPKINFRVPEVPTIRMNRSSRVPVKPSTNIAQSKRRLLRLAS